MNCLNCGIEITQNRKFCSDKCRYNHHYANTITSKPCSVCGKEFKGKGKERCCSDKCRKKAQRIYKKTCPICKKSFKARGNGIYCSNICYRTANSPSKGLTVAHCKVCGNGFRTSLVAHQLVCSDECSSKLFSVYINQSLVDVFGTTDKKEIAHLLKDNFQKEKGVLDNA